MSRKHAATIGILTLCAIGGCSRAGNPFGDARPDQLKILASFTPLYCFAANVAGDHAKVLCFLTAKGPHDFQSTASDSIKVAKADLFLINGLGVDEFAAKMVSDARLKKDVVFEVAEALDDSKLIHLDEGDRKHVHADGGEHAHGEHDPHVWLGPVHAQLMVEKIAEKLGELKPELKQTFADQAAAYAKQLEELHSYGLKKLEAKKNRRVIVTHDFLRYFAQAYKLEIAGSIRPKASDEADAGQLAKLAKLCKEKDVRVIIVEPQFAKGPAEILQTQLKREGVKVRLVEFDPMETAAAGADGNPDPGLYVRRMRENIDHLAEALP